jgi:uncharacterized protein
VTVRAKPKLLRDPVHDIISIDPNETGGELILALIDTPEFQRLRRIRQLALSFLVYHGAEHSRFSHSTGVYWLARRMLRQLSQSVTVTEEQAVVTLCASLCHDLGHGPFSHAIEGVTGERHELRTIGLLTHPDSRVAQTLAAYDPALPEAVAGIISGDSDIPPYLREIVSSQLDADRLDYILRDGHATGVQIGRFDLARILALLQVQDGHLAIHKGAAEAVEGYLLARFHMYKQVYLHRASRAAEKMLKSALLRAGRLHKEGHDIGYWPVGPFGKLLEGERLEHPEFALIDDIDVWMAMKEWCTSPERGLADLARGLNHRGVWKVLDLPDDEDEASVVIAQARDVAKRHGFLPDVHVLVDECADSPYRPFTGVGKSAQSIRVADGKGGGWFIEERSDLIGLMGTLSHRERNLCVHPDLRPLLEI